MHENDKNLHIKILVYYTGAFCQVT